MSSDPPPAKRLRTTLQEAGQFVKHAFHPRPSQLLGLGAPSPSSQPAQNHPPAGNAQLAQTEVIPQSAKPTAAPGRGVKRAARVAWSKLENALRTLQQSSDVFPPIKPAVNGLLACIDVFEASREEYDELAVNLAIILNDLAKHLRESRSVQMSNCVSSIVSPSGIEQQIDSINFKKARPGIQRSLEAQQDIDDLIGCYRRIEMLFRQLQNTRLESMRPAKDAHYDSAMAAVVRRRQCTPNTRQTVLESLRAWKDDPNGAKVYWMNGMAGTGKTTIASTLCSELETAHQLAASFFCSRELPDCRDATRIVPTISYQLARFSLPFQSALCETLANNPDASTRSIGVQFEKLIKEPLLRVKETIPDGVVVVIDALDECSDGVSAQLFLDALYRFTEGLSIRFFVTCRPAQSFSKKLLSWNQTSRTLFHLHDIEQSVVRGDIEIYLRAELEELSLDHIRQLSERSGKLFIFAATVRRYVKPDDASGIWHERLETMLRAEWNPGSKAYSSIDTLYSTILSAALSRDEFELADVETMKRALYTVICSKEPMTIETLAGVLGGSLDRLVRVVDPLRSVLHVSEGSRLVSTLHASFPDYMLNRERSKNFFCDTGIHHHLLALRCFHVMKQSLRFNICNLESSYLLDEDVPDLLACIDNTISSHLSYACSHWADHLCEAGTEGGLVDSLGDFFYNSVLFWLEVLNLKKCIGSGITVLAKVHKWLQERNAPSAVCGIAQDAHKFATLVGICKSTPHIYVSVLALWNREDPMWIAYGTRTQGLVQLQSALHSNGTPALLATWHNDDPVRSIAVSRDGSRVVSNYKKQFVVWDAYTGNQISSPLDGHMEHVISVAISPNGRTIASGSYDGTVYIWDAQTADVIVGPLEGHTSSVYSVAFSPDGARIASGSKDCTIRIWDTHTGLILVGPLEGHTGPVHSVAFSPDGGRVASGSDDCTVRTWDAQTGHMLMSPFEGHGDAVNSVGFSPDGARIASGSDDWTIRTWDTRHGNTLIGPLGERDGDIVSIMFSLDGTRIVSGSSYGAISIFDAQSGRELAGPFDAHTDVVRSVAFSLQDNRLISGSEDGTIRIWHVNAASRNVYIPSILSVAFLPDNSSIASWFRSGDFRIWNLRTGDLLAEPLKGHPSVCSVAFPPDGAHIALGFYNGNIEIWDTENGNMLLGPLEGHTSFVSSLAFSPDGRRIVSGSDDHTILLWDAHTGNILFGPLKGHVDPLNSVAFSPDGAQIASGSDDCTIRIWNVQTGDMLLGPLVGHSGAVSSVGFSPDGRYLVSGSEDCTICVWNTQTGNMLTHPFEGHTEQINSVAFSSDGSRVVSGSDDCTIRIWDAHTGRTAAGTFRAHTKSVYSVAFSPDDSRVVSGSDDGRILVWELHGGDHDVSNIADGWTLHDDGWIVGRNSARLLWLPPTLRTLPPGPKPTVIHAREPFGIDFNIMAVGTRWTTCFSG
ncbi:hypothetical protein FRC10_003784 [Ceratobasidium sp. 414]|nr:hypothetical protein FRC10_003784 [Ceratobasidium sp. 414]